VNTEIQSPIVGRVGMMPVLGGVSIQPYDEDAWNPNWRRWFFDHVLRTVLAESTVWVCIMTGDTCRGGLLGSLVLLEDLELPYSVGDMVSKGGYGFVDVVVGLVMSAPNFALGIETIARMTEKLFDEIVLVRVNTLEEGITAIKTSASEGVSIETILQSNNDAVICFGRGARIELRGAIAERAARLLRGGDQP
jgi:hypothetical protein